MNVQQVLDCADALTIDRQGRVVPPRPLTAFTPGRRLREAWDVLCGRADALYWGDFNPLGVIAHDPSRDFLGFWTKKLDGDIDFDRDERRGEPGG